jgi:hypothetical protein
VPPGKYFPHGYGGRIQLRAARMIAVLLLPLIALAAIGAIRFFSGSLRARTDIPGSHSESQVRLRLTGVVILAAGLCGAGAIYLETPGPVAPSGLGYATTGQYSTTYMPGETKQSEAQNEIINGKGGMLFTDVREWFVSLWHGRRLAYTVAVLSVAAFLVCLSLAHPLVARANSLESGDDEPEM